MRYIKHIAPSSRQTVIEAMEREKLYKLARLETARDADAKFEAALGVMLMRLGGEVKISSRELLQDIVVFQRQDPTTLDWKFKAIKNQ